MATRTLSHSRAVPLQGDDGRVPDFASRRHLQMMSGEAKAVLIVMGAKAGTSLTGNVPHTKAHRVVTGARCPDLTVRSWAN